MRKFHMKKKAAVAVAAAALTVTAAGGAFAYWTTTGSGSGSATNASSNGTIVLHAAFGDGLTPGASEPVSFTADNGGSSSLYVGTITMTGATVDAAHSGCAVGDFTMPSVDSKTTVPAHSTGFALGGSGTVTYADTSSDQSACKGAIITLNLTSN